nr:hypothetical protein [Tanacetum cinerariifolium]
MLTKAIAIMTHEQKRVVTEMGFGGLLKLTLETIPVAFAWYVVGLLDTDEMVLDTPKGKIPIDRMAVHEILGFPLGNRQILRRKVSNYNTELAKQWKSYSKESLEMSDISIRIIKITTANRMFQVDFLILMAILMIIAMKNNKINREILITLPPNFVSKEYDWCEYVVHAQAQCCNSTPYDAESAYSLVGNQVPHEPPCGQLGSSLSVCQGPSRLCPAGQQHTGQKLQEVSRKKRRSVFHRLNYSHASNVDDLAKISLSVYVSNFPSHLTKRELWNICGKVGTLADVFIADRKHKLGQMYAFCRYIKVVNPKNITDSLCKIRIGKLRLHANVARFSRNEVGSQPKKLHVKAKSHSTGTVIKDRKESFFNKGNSYVIAAKGNSCSIGVSNQVDARGTSSSLNINVLNINEFPLDSPSMALLGCYKDFHAIANTRSMCRSEGFLDVEFKYLGGLWVLFEFSTQEVKVNFQKHKGILAYFSSLTPWYDEFVVKERLIWLEIEGVPFRAWDNDVFAKICCKWDEVLFLDDTDKCYRLSKRVCIKSSHALLVFATIMVTLNNVIYVIRVRGLCSWTPNLAEENSQDEEQSCKASNANHSVTPEFPPGFSPTSNGSPHNTASSHNYKSNSSKFQVGFSMIERLEETIKVGLALGLNMDGCETTLASLIAGKGDLKWLKKDMLGGYNFTWTNKLGTKISKLDRFLTSKSFHEDFPHVTGIVLEKGDPDHRPILLKEIKVDYGPTPFPFYHPWLEMEGFQDMILGDINRLEANDIAQKAKVKWAIEGDENTSFFHGMLNKKRRQLAIRGVFKDGAWIEEPFNVKAEFLDHFSKRFQRSHGITPSLDGDMPNYLSPMQSEFLERQISREEIKKDVWDCGGERAPGPDGFTFKFVTTFWDLIEDDVIRIVLELKLFRDAVAAAHIK